MKTALIVGAGPAGLTALSTKEAVNAIRSGSKDKSAIWRVNSEKDYHEGINCLLRGNFRFSQYGFKNSRNRSCVYI